MLRDEVAKAFKVIQDGGIILYPTDTIWGIGCDAANTEAVKKIFHLKQREKNFGRNSLPKFIAQQSRTTAYMAKSTPRYIIWVVN